MGKMIEMPRTNIISFRVTDDEKARILATKQGGHTGTHVRHLVLAGLDAQQQKSGQSEE